MVLFISRTFNFNLSIIVTDGILRVGEYLYDENQYRKTVKFLLRDPHSRLAKRK
jgi:hypothetical protein